MLTASLVLHVFIFYKLFVDNRAFHKEMDTQMVAVPKTVDISGRKYITSLTPVTQLQTLTEMALHSPLTLDYLRDYLKEYQIDFLEQSFVVEEGILNKGQPAKGTNYWGVVEGRRLHGLECFALAFDPGNYKIIQQIHTMLPP